MSATGNGWRQTMITALLSMLLTVCGAWFAWGRQTVSRADVTEMIRTQDPYLPDRQTVQTLKASLDGLSLRVQDQGEKIASLSAIMERVERQLERRISR